jgi:thermitase
VVAVIDTGVDMGHPLFAGKLHSYGWDFVDGHQGGWDLPNGVDDDNDGLVDEAVGHGTHIAGSVLLVDPKCRILPVRALDSDGAGSGYRVAESIFYAVDAGANVINLSLSFQVLSGAVIAALQYAEAFGVTVLTSAGNTGGPVLFPGDYDPLAVTWKLPLLGQLQLNGNSILTVAAVNSGDQKLSFSAYGPHVDISAPGAAIYSSVPGGTYAWWSGTSMATGIASGVAALTIGIGGPYPLTNAPFLLRQTAVDTDAKNPGYAGQLGEGRVDAWAAGLAALGFP